MGKIHDPEKVSLLDGNGPHHDEYTRFRSSPHGWKGLKTMVVLGIMYGVYAITTRAVIFALRPGRRAEPHHGLSWVHGAIGKHRGALGSPEKVEELYLYVSCLR